MKLPRRNLQRDFMESSCTHADAVDATVVTAAADVKADTAVKAMTATAVAAVIKRYR